MNAIEPDAPAAAAWRAWGASLARPSAVLVISAHWQSTPPRVGAVAPTPLVYDFGGFPEPLYAVRYAPPGAPELAREVSGLLAGAGLKPADEPTRGLDHGAWVPLVHLFPGASVPVLQVSLGDGPATAEHVALGRALAPLRKTGVLLLASGNVTHNLGLANFDDAHAPADAWATDFDAWVQAAVERGDVDALADFEKKAPAADRACPTDEHFTPLIVAAAAAAERRASVRYPYAAIEHQNLAMRCIEFA